MKDRRQIDAQRFVGALRCGFAGFLHFLLCANAGLRVLPFSAAFERRDDLVR